MSERVQYSRADIYFASMWCFLTGAYAMMAVVYLIDGLPFSDTAFLAAASGLAFVVTMRKIEKIRGTP